MRRCAFFVLFFFLLANIGSAQKVGKLVSGRGGMAVSACPLATEVGLQVLRNGGNAVDAAVAMGFALAVTYPSAGNLGGGSFLLIRMADGRSVAIDARETAPQAAHRDMYLDENGVVKRNASLIGPLAAGTPGTVDGLLSALEKFGSMQRAEVMQPAYRYAEVGFIPNRRLLQLLQRQAASLRLFASTAACYLPDGKPPLRKRKWKQPDLAETLKRIIDRGRDGFYSGVTARSIADAMRRDGGLITEGDLQRYHSLERLPLTGTYRGLDILTMPSPSSGGIALLQMLAVLEKYNNLAAPAASALTVHVMSETMRRAFADRAVFAGDPQFTAIPIDSLLDDAVSEAWFQAIDTANASNSDAFGQKMLQPQESDNTTHYAVLDAHGNAVCVTTTLNSSFGSYYVVPGTGILLNNEMDDFSVKSGSPDQFGLIGGEANSIAPGKRMVSSMIPTIVLYKKKVRILTGSSGGSRIITSVLQSIMNVVDFSMSPDKALSASRFHHQWYPNRIEYEKEMFTPALKEELLKKGHTLVEVPAFGRVEMIFFDAEKGIMYGSSDPRGYGTAGVLDKRQ